MKYKFAFSTTLTTGSFSPSQRIVVAQIRPSHPLRVPGTQGQLFQEHTVSKQMDIVPGNSFRLFPTEGCTPDLDTVACGLFFVTGASRPLKSFQRMLGLMASASPVLQLGLLHMRPLQRWLTPRIPSDAWSHGRLRIKVNRACGRRRKKVSTSTA